jgi:hypothetical protein
VVGLDAADRHEGVGSLGQGIGNEVLELADLVASEREPRVAVLALGPDGRAAEMLGESIEGGRDSVRTSTGTGGSRAASRVLSLDRDAPWGGGKHRLLHRRIVP